MGHPVLRQIAHPVDPLHIHTEAFQAFCDDLLETMVEYDGAGLAAPQVHHSIRVVVLVLDQGSEAEFLINPSISPLSDEVRRTYEGCLSVEGIRGAVDRWNHIRVEFLDRTGNHHSLELEGMPAVVVQHECDHLDGVLYIDRAFPETLAFTREFQRFGPLDYLSVGQHDDGEE